MDVFVSKLALDLLDNYAQILYQYQSGRDSPSETRNLILVIVTLIAAGTFQAGINPPGGFWQDDQDGHVAGMSIMASRKGTTYLFFLIFNALALSVSTAIIITFTARFPLKNEIWIASLCMLATYASAVTASSPPEMSFLLFILLVALIPLLIRIWVFLNKFLSGEVGSSERDRTRNRDEDEGIVLYANDLRRVIRKYAYGNQAEEERVHQDQVRNIVLLTADDVRRIIGRLNEARNR